MGQVLGDGAWGHGLRPHRHLGPPCGGSLALGTGKGSGWAQQWL